MEMTPQGGSDRCQGRIPAQNPGPDRHFGTKSGPGAGSEDPPGGVQGSGPGPAKDPPRGVQRSGVDPLGVCLGRALATSPRLVQLNGTSHFAMLISSSPLAPGSKISMKCIGGFVAFYLVDQHLSTSHAPNSPSET